MKELTLRYGITGAAVAAVAIAGMILMYSTQLMAHAQTSTTNTMQPPSSLFPPPITAKAENTTQIITNLTYIEENRLTSWYDSENQRQYYGAKRITEPLSPQNIEYQQTDPEFLKLAQITYDCILDYETIFYTRVELNQGPFTDEEIIRQDRCTDLIRQGIDQICENTTGATFNVSNKCEEAKDMSRGYLYTAESLFG